MAHKLSEYSDIPEFTNNSVWRENPAIQLNIKLLYVKHKYGESAEDDRQLEEMSTEEAFLYAQKAAMREELTELERKSVHDSAEGGNGMAMLLYAQELLDSNKYEEAFQWAKKAEEEMAFGACSMEAYLLMTGKCGDADEGEIIDLLKLGVKTADPISLRLLGLIALNGTVMESDPSYGRDLLECAAALGDEQAASIFESLK